MFVAVDDTDSVRGNCTTFLATEIIRELSDFDLIGNPRLVRLNPAVPWKTRGNGSLVMEFGKGIGKKTFIGIIGREIYSYEKSEKINPDLKKIMNRLIPLVEKYHESDADPGLIVTNKKSSPIFYKKGVTTILDKKIILEELERIGAETFTIGNGRGLIGATCGLAWKPKDSTYELLAYRHRKRWGTEREFVPESIRDMEHNFPTTFNSWEDRMNKVAMIPGTPCPVLYGLRGDNLKDVIKAAETLETEERERWIVYLTNQGTDDHIIRNPKELVPNQSYSLKGTVKTKAKHIQGSHVFIDVETKFGTVTCGAYEPSKEFRLVFDHLIPGDRIEIVGELRDSPRTLNVEKLHVISLTKSMEKISNPLCKKCGKKMESAGKDQGYRCKKCHTKSDKAVYRENFRWILPGWYEPPTAARRHLSKPLKRMGLEQPVDFLILRSRGKQYNNE